MPSVEHEEIVAMFSGGLGLEERSVEEQRAMMRIGQSNGLFV